MSIKESSWKSFRSFLKTKPNTIQPLFSKRRQQRMSVTDLQKWVLEGWMDSNAQLELPFPDHSLELTESGCEKILRALLTEK